MSVGKKVDAGKLLKDFERFIAAHRSTPNREILGSEPVRALLDRTGTERIALVHAMFERLGDLAQTIAKKEGDRLTTWTLWTNFHDKLGSWYDWVDVFALLLRKGCAFTPSDWDQALESLTRFRYIDLFSHRYLPTLLAKLERDIAKSGISDTSRGHLRAIGAAIAQKSNASEQRLAARVASIADYKKARQDVGLWRTPEIVQRLLDRERIKIESPNLTEQFRAAIRFDPDPQSKRPMWFEGLPDEFSRLAESVVDILIADALAHPKRYSEGVGSQAVKDLQRLASSRPDLMPAVVAIAGACAVEAPPDALSSDVFALRDRIVSRALSVPQAVCASVAASKDPTAVRVLDELSRIAKAEFSAISVHDWTAWISGNARAWLAAAAKAQHSLFRFREYVMRHPFRAYSNLDEMDKALGLLAPVPVPLGEPWIDQLTREWGKMSAKQQGLWRRVCLHAAAASGGSPGKKWMSLAGELIKEAGAEAFRTKVGAWLSRGCTSRPEMAGGPIEGIDAASPTDRSSEMLKGLAWMIGAAGADAPTARVLSALAMRSYQKVPGIGPRAVKVGHACIHALGQMPGTDSLAQLAMLKVKVKFIPAQKGIEKALTAAAIREHLPREEIEELAVPSYGLGDVGAREDVMGEFTARLEVDSSAGCRLTFIRKDGKSIKTVPAVLKKDHAENLKELKLSMKDIGSMLPAQKDRIDSLFLEQNTWAMGTWRERYLDHPLVGVLARRIIWQFRDRADGTWTSATWLDGKLCDAKGLPRTFREQSAVVRLWHPMLVEREEILAWRRFFEERGLRQPFKQAHREIYLLTDAERTTGTYSNRYAAHIIRQHQFHALAAARGWRNRLRLLVDAEFPPATRTLSKWGLRAEFWIEGAGDDFGVDTNEAGAFHHLATDQVRFYRERAPIATAHANGGGYTTTRVGGEDARDTEHEPLPLDQIPPLVFSEIMRDVDLFVGVASVGNNPQWQDGGPDNRYRDYWWSYGFGELSDTALSRSDLLGRLIPRLKIADRCELSERFLIVQGKLREYKIHLGSGNILMRPDDEYLCIVPSSRDVGDGSLHLPFDGDRTLSIILSKAFLLVNDDRIRDSSITSQIKRGLK